MSPPKQREPQHQHRILTCLRINTPANAYTPCICSLCTTDATCRTRTSVIGVRSLAQTPSRPSPSPHQDRHLSPESLSNQPSSRLRLSKWRILHSPTPYPPLLHLR